MLKKILKIIWINTLVLMSLLIILEAILHMSDMKTVAEIDEKIRQKSMRINKACQKLGKQKLEVYHTFYTDHEGIFKANPKFFLNNKDNITINKDGFRGHPFEYIKTPQTKLLLLGDSFTWGATARPLSNSFADLLSRAGYYVYNSGIAGTGPQQYCLIAEKYVSKLKPDVVVLCFYMGNDLKMVPDIIRPNENLHYVTNFGFLSGHDEAGSYFKNAEESFEYLKKRKCGCGFTVWDSIRFKTIIGSFIYRLIKKPVQNPTKKTYWITESLKRIHNTCERNHVPCIVFIIPKKNQPVTQHPSIRNPLDLFKDFTFYYPETLTGSDYCPNPNDHFNNSGHKKFAEFMIDKLTRYGFPPAPQEKNDSQ